MFICLPRGHLRCGWLCFFSRTQTKIFNSNRCSLSVIWYSWIWERKKHTQTKPNCDDTLRSKDSKRSVCARNWTVFRMFFFFFTSDPPYCPTVLILSAFTTVGALRVDFFSCLLYSGSQTNKCITATYLSNGPLTLYLQSQLGVSG